MRPGDRYSLVIEEVAERRKVEVVDGSRGPCLWVSRPVLRGLGVNCDREMIVELTIGNARTSVRRRTFMKYRPAMGAVQAFVASVGYQPGDIVELIAGDLVPADSRLLASRDLYVNQALLTGEPYPIEKRVTDVASGAENPAGASNAVFAAPTRRPSIARGDNPWSAACE